MSAGSKEKSVKIDECGTSYAHTTKSNPVQIVERNDNNAGVCQNYLASLRFLPSLGHWMIYWFAFLGFRCVRCENS